MSTIRDVARRSGVSVATVSYVLNNGPRPVRPETRQRVLDAMRELDYHPNAMARGLARRKMNTLGVLLPMVETTIVTNPYASGILRGILQAAAGAGYNVTLFTERWRSARESLGVFRDRRTDGLLLVAPPMDSDMLPALAGLDMPLAVISAPAGWSQTLSVDVDNMGGALQATEYLIALGHRRIAHITGHTNLASVPPRVEGYRRALCAAGIEP
ncbi:MAG: LacI family transcriptional regulator, partial [Methanobacterium paludis]|nr:LacI family transcriptional regulator [Methanobacterium paludis]